ncbi:MAG: metallophosphoesterase [Armatimonadetes bacterium]|nr:metallophosphoesterase [Armatimonadota bacterium]
MRWLPFLAGGAVVGAGVLTYGCLVGSKQLVREDYKLRLPRWPKRLDGFRIAVLADFHLRDKYSRELVDRAIMMALDASPDMVVLAGDFVAYWKESSIQELGEALEPLLLMQGNVVAIPGNHEYWAGSPEFLRPVLEELSIKYLENEAWVHAGIRWVGIDSFISGRPDPVAAYADQMGHDPTIVLWHEPDWVELVPDGAALMISGHTHGGQFRFPGGFTPMYTKGGRRFPRGFYPDASTPLFVTRGVGTTGPPSRLNCKPEVAILELHPA